MGLDTVELVLAVEEAFQIHISDEEAGNVSTAGELNALIVSKLRGRTSEQCLTSAAFYRTRRAIIDSLGVSRREVKPSARLDQIFPRRRRREHWRRVQNAMTLDLPALQHPVSLQIGLITTGVTATVGAGIYRGVSVPWVCLLFMTGVVAGGILIRLSPALASAFPNGNVTVGDLAKDVLAVNHARLVKDVGAWNEKDVWTSLCRVIVLQTGVRPEKITPDARLVHDLRID